MYLVLLCAGAVASRMRCSIAPNTLRLKSAVGGKVTRLTAVLAHQVPAAVVLEINDCFAFLEVTNEVVQQPSDEGFLARTNHDGTKTSTRKSDRHTMGISDKTLL